MSILTKVGIKKSAITENLVENHNCADLYKELKVLSSICFI